MKPHRFREPHYVYRLYDEQRRCLYVGCTITPHVRIGFHVGKEWGHLIHSSLITEHVHKQAALKVEREEIVRLQPLYNLVHTPHYVYPRRKTA